MTEIPNYELESLRRSIAMLTPGAAAVLTREQALWLLSEVQRLRALGTEARPTPEA